MKNKTLYLIRNVIFFLFCILLILFFVFDFYTIRIFDIQFFPLLESVVHDFSIFYLSLFGILVILTLLFGRIYCSFLCPLGIIQEILFCIFKPLYKNSKNSQNKNYIKYIIAAVFYGAFIGGSVFLSSYLEPHFIFLSSFLKIKTSIIILSIILFICLFKPRFFCVNICPVGTLLGIISRCSKNKINIDSEKCINCKMCEKNCQTRSINISNKTVNNETCVKCFRCLNVCKKQAINFSSKKENKVIFDKSRRRFLFDALCFGVFLATYKRIAFKTRHEIQRIKNIIIPPGGKDNQEFLTKCLNCNLCIKNCPSKILKEADSDFGAVHINFDNGFCKYDCNMCSKVCPAGAIKDIDINEKQRTQIAIARVDEKECIQCGICVSECPRNAIEKEEGESPKINEKKCIGCGKCVFNCPVKAIKIEPLEEQNILDS